MDPDPLVNALADMLRKTDLADLLTVTIGVAGTVIGVVLGNRHAARRADIERSRDAAAAALALIDTWWLPHRDRETGEPKPAEVVVEPQDSVASGRAIARIQDRRVRRASEIGLNAIRDMRIGFKYGELAGNPIDHQRQVMKWVGLVLQAHSRGDKPRKDVIEKISSYYAKTTLLRSAPPR